MTNGGYKIIDFEGLELKTNKSNTNTEIFDRIAKASKSGKPILINNVKFISEGNSGTYSEVSTPIFFQLVSIVTNNEITAYSFILPNNITGTITKESITIN